MKKEKAKARHSALNSAFVGILILFFLFTGSAWSQPRGGPSHHGPRHGEHFGRLPDGYRTGWAGKEKFFYHRGVFYRNAPHGFVVVRAPIGAIVAYLPIGFTTVLIGRIPYYYYDDVYYRRVPSGYVVVEPPPNVPPPAPPPAVEPPQPGPSEGRVAVTAERLNVRSGPGMNNPILFQAVKGTVLVIQGAAEGWYYVQLPNGQFGWVMQSFTAPLAPPASG